MDKWSHLWWSANNCKWYLGPIEEKKNKRLNKVYPWIHLEKHFFSPRSYKIALVVSAGLKMMKQEARLVMNCDGWLTYADKLMHSVFTGRPAGCYTKQCGSWGFFFVQVLHQPSDWLYPQRLKKTLRWMHAENPGFYEINKMFELLVEPPHIAMQLDRGDLQHEILHVHLGRSQSNFSLSIR